MTDAPQAYIAFMDSDEAASSRLDFPAELQHRLTPADGTGDEGDVARLAQEILSDLGTVADNYVTKLYSDDTGVGRKYMQPLANEIHGIYGRLVPDRH